jgi:hypothetical protein
MATGAPAVEFASVAEMEAATGPMLPYGPEPVELDLSPEDLEAIAVAGRIPAPPSAGEIADAVVDEVGR